MASTDNQYCNSLFSYSRLKTKEALVGKLGIGAENPIRLQSMTTTETLDTIPSVEQTIRMVNAGCELVRFTAPGIRHSENLRNIKEELANRGIHVPLVADIHFTPNAADVAADIVEKVRVNPGNYADKKKFEEIDYTDESYNAELERIRTKFTPLVLKCKKNGVALRIGTNHGSLSDRIMSRYGDTANGMVESAMEFVRICEDNNFYNMVISMKSSNPKVMVQAYRLLAKTMIERDQIYPLHLGVTEAGEGEDGRIKSAVGIGTLLEDGLGDTIRVSLTEEPEAEIPVAKILADRYSDRISEAIFPQKSPIDPFNYTKRKTTEIDIIGESNVPRVILDLKDKSSISRANLFAGGYMYSEKLDKWNITDQACDYLYLGKNKVDFEIPGTLKLIQDADIWTENSSSFPLFDPEAYIHSQKRHSKLNFLVLNYQDLQGDILAKIKSDQTTVLLLKTDNPHAMAELRAAFFMLINQEVKNPVIVQRDYSGIEKDAFQLFSSTDIGGLLIDGLGDGIMLSADNLPSKFINETAFGILQATRTRISKTDYISCPSCGRTLFDLQETTAKIRKRTDHLKGLKIGIMGCIVNGPGEMADADYGYVGTGPGKITLYKEKTVVKKNVPEDDAVEELVQLIREHGDWIEPKSLIEE